MEHQVDNLAESAAAADERVDEAARQISPFKARFGRAATRVSDTMGTPWAFTLAVAVILVWVVTGPIFGFSDTWQLAINTSTSIVTFLMVFLIENTQNRNAKAMQLKLDELIRAIGDARNQLIGAELEPEELVEREKRAVEAEKNKSSSGASLSGTPNGRPHDGEPAGHR